MSAPPEMSVQQDADPSDLSSGPRSLRWLLRASWMMLWTIVAIAGFTMWRNREPRPTDELPRGTIGEDGVIEPYAVGRFTLTDSNGRPVTEADLAGRPWVAAFIFTRCTESCPMLTARMTELQAWLSDLDARLVCISVDPQHDTPAVLKRHAQAAKADARRWLFLTGSKTEIHRLIHQGFQQPILESPDPTVDPGRRVTHSPNLMLVDRRGMVVGKFNGLRDTELAALRQAIEKLGSANRADRPTGRPTVAPRP